jgi:hypothetical protein
MGQKTRMSQTPPTFTAFRDHTRLAAGALAEVALRVRRALDEDPARPVLVFSDADGRVVDLDLRGSPEEIAGRLAPPAAEPRGRGRPKLGVTPREVTLLPKHWDWLSSQPGGASVALRKLVEAAMRSGEHEARRRRETAYRFMSAVAGDLPGFEEASRALFAGDEDRFHAAAAGWPADVRDHADRLAFG